MDKGYQGAADVLRAVRRNQFEVFYIEKMKSTTGSCHRTVYSSKASLVAYVSCVPYVLQSMVGQKESTNFCLM